MNIALSLSLSLSPSPPPSIHSSTNPALKTAASSSQASSPYPTSAINGPYLGVVLIVLLITFFLMAAFSVYMRRYAFSLASQAGPGTDRSGRGRGLDRAAIDGLPIVVYHCAKGESKDEAVALAHEWSPRSDCVVCLTDFQEAEKLRLLPRCEHCFHPECIDMWLGSHNTCPLCRRSLLPPPPPAAAAANNEVCISVQAPPPSVAPSNSASAPSSATS